MLMLPGDQHRAVAGQRRFHHFGVVLLAMTFVLVSTSVTVNVSNSDEVTLDEVERIVI
jgi:hypothetical protein